MKRLLLLVVFILLNIAVLGSSNGSAGATVSAGFQISPAEEDQFYQRISSYYSVEERQAIRGDLKRLKSRYPEGYFVLIKMCSREPQGFHAYYRGDDPGSYNVIIHEMSHAAVTPCLFEDNRMGDCDKIDSQVFLIEDILVKIPYNDALAEVVEHKSEHILAAIAAPREFDRIYLHEDTGGPSYSLLDEMNAYIKSVRAAAFEPTALLDDINHLLRLRYHLNLLFLEMSRDRRAWQLLVEDSAFVTIALKLRQLAMAEDIDLAPYRQGQNRAVLAEIDETTALLQQTDSVLVQLDHRFVDRDFFSLKELHIEAIPFNDLGLAGPVVQFSAGENPYHREEELESSSGSDQDDSESCGDTCEPSPGCEQCLDNQDGILDQCEKVCQAFIVCLDSCGDEQMP